ncbi:lipopolysaccharide transport periplasmic protein LptA [Aliiglaciecola sp. CAU 1673]|uniref:lipopolysaccharide transport periplasmic protein LptA n=1 Tax=Aliiglaciecola sp. CAU 1673 TaxID=3032595 RepID=UPI0023DCCCEF|nr:lipopolysaccharide transport periplasmic protein LptA [Aliiglaciecola sp. CAU 1673]MDF2178474.1 lipopolysaccharide transport periplasmic protein LptA [Aliiglaciecola sp. CAU 1673]
MAKTFSSALVLATVITSSQVVAVTQDFKQPIKVDAKYQFVDGKNKTSVFKEDVHISQGSLYIQADEVELRADQGEGREVFIARGKPATYEQTLEDGSRIKAVADSIEYQVNSRTLALAGHAELHQNSSSVSGESIVFNMEKEQLIAQGSDDNTGRVTTIFQPDTSKGAQQEPAPEKDQPKEP